MKQPNAMAKTTKWNDLHSKMAQLPQVTNHHQSGQDQQAGKIASSRDGPFCFRLLAAAAGGGVGSSFSHSSKIPPPTPSTHLRIYRIQFQISTNSNNFLIFSTHGSQQQQSRHVWIWGVRAEPADEYCGDGHGLSCHTPTSLTSSLYFRCADIQIVSNSGLIRWLTSLLSFFIHFGWFAVRANSNLGAELTLETT